LQIAQETSTSIRGMNLKAVDVGPASFSFFFFCFLHLIMSFRRLRLFQTIMTVFGTLLREFQSAWYPQFCENFLLEIPPHMPRHFIIWLTFFLAVEIKISPERPELHLLSAHSAARLSLAIKNTFFLTKFLEHRDLLSQ